MDKKIFVKWGTIILLIIAVLIIIEVTTKALSKVKVETIKSEDIIKQHEEEQKQIQEEQKIVTAVDILIEDIKAKNYEKIYEQLNEIYREYKFPTLEDFTSFLSGRFKDDMTYKIISSSKVEDVSLYGISYTAEDSAEVNIQYISIKKENDKYQIMFDNIVRIKNHGYKINQTDIDIVLKYEIIYRYNNLFVIDILNKTGKTIVLSHDDIKINRRNKNTWEKLDSLDSEYKETITNNQNKRIEIYFPEYLEGYVSEAEILLSLENRRIFYLPIVRDDGEELDAD